jgi:butyrate kinase
MMHDYYILAINPGSTSTKLGLYKNLEKIYEETLRHDASELAPFPTIWDQYEFRKEVILKALREHPQKPPRLDGVVGRGGLLKPIISGTYEVNDELESDARNNYQGEHASNLGAVLARDIAKEYGCPSYMVDPPAVCEYQRLAFYSGHPLINRRSIHHALNVHAIARKASKDIGKPYTQTRFIIAHLGGGVTVNAIAGGKVIDSNDGMGEGPFTPERSGSLPMQQFAELCYSRKYTLKEIRKMITGKGGMVAYLGTNSAAKVEEAAKNGDTKSAEVYEAMVYQIAKEIGAQATVLEGKYDGIILTGGLAYSDHFCELINSRISFLGKIMRYPGEDEIMALVEGAFRALNGEEKAKTYPQLGEEPPKWDFKG